MYLNILFVLILYTFSTFAQRTPTISQITQEQIKDIGDTVVLECSVQYAKDYSVQWIKNSEEPQPIFLSSGSTLIIKDSRFFLRYDVPSSTYVLSIKDIQETDAGQYECKILLSIVNAVSAKVLLSVRRPPIISDNSTPSLVASEGDSVQIECYASGYPTPTINWHRDNNAILSTDGTTYAGNILKVRKDDRGRYYCVFIIT